MLVTLLCTLLGLSLMVCLHELGHMIVAKKNGVLVHEFSIGMGPRLVAWGKGETTYSLRLLPLGGYVRMEGGEDDSENSRAVTSLSPWRRACVMLAGVALNLLLGLVLFTAINMATVVTPPIVADSDPAKGAAVLQSGDRIVRMNKTPIHTYNDLSTFLMMNGASDVDVTVKRDGQKLRYTLTPTYSDGNYLLGITLAPSFRPNILQAVQYGFYDCEATVRMVVGVLKRLVLGQEKLTSLSGPIGIAEVVDDAREQIPDTRVMILFIMQLCAMISVNLGVFNLLPFPGLDGGQLVFTIYEGITRRKVNETLVGVLNMAGLALVLLLGVMVMLQDIGKLIQ